MITCQNNGTCNFNSSSTVYICQCVNNFYGPNCQYQPLNSKTFINSTILTQELGVSLMNLIGIKSNSAITKVYQASINGFVANNFHSKVYGIKGSLFVIKSTNGNVFGGFTKISLGLLPEGWYSDPSSFLFSLINQQNYPCKLNPKDNNAQIVPASKNYIVAFGSSNSTASGSDIAIYDESNSQIQSYSNLGFAYQLPQNITIDTKFFFAGSYNFQTLEIEVYTGNNFYQKNSQI